MNFESWLQHIGKSPSSAKKYSIAISGAISSWAKEAELVDKSLLEIQDSKTLQHIASSLSNVEIFVQRNTKGNGMYSAALKKYQEYLSDITGEDLADDIQQIVNDKAIASTEKAVYINARVGQGKFRQGLIDMWRGCSVTGFSDTRFLVASHIKPWKVSNNTERLDPYNGLLLLPNLDKVFDLRYITFSEKGEILIHKELEDYSKLGINKSFKINISDKHQENMAYHRSMFFSNK
ncbi:MAG: HNH endonuclease [Gammaproteobacteria bacterium]|nr:HNH endonuclease [Gammaproteobacteria bacterium]